MTRLETSGEPSMEEILASIRRIIAEEPSGARATPAPASRPQLHQAPVERTQPQREQSAPFPLGAKRDFIPRTEPAAAPLRAPSSTQFIPRDAAQSSRPAPEPEPARQLSMRDLGTEAEPAKPADSIQAQLDDLLADELGNAKATASSAAPQSSAPNSAPSASSNASTSGRPAEAASQPRFTVSRDGFVPPAAQEGDADESDPFEFDLGPSPFSKRPAAPENASKAEARKVETREQAALDERARQESAAAPARAVVENESAASPSVAAPGKTQSAAETARSQPARQDAGKIEEARFEDDKPKRTIEHHRQEPARADAAPRPAAANPQPRDPLPANKSEPLRTASTARGPGVEPRTVQPLAAPSIAATLPPAAEIAAAKARADAEAFARSLELMSSRSAYDPIKDVVTEAVNIAMGPAPSNYSAVDFGGAPIAVELVDSAPLSSRHQLTVRDPGGPSHSANMPAVRDGENGIRSMEDTVADLLRPMLKIWLAENMPKIIERALRREISEMTSSGHQHKTAAE